MLHPYRCSYDFARVLLWMMNFDFLTLCFQKRPGGSGGRRWMIKKKKCERRWECAQSDTWSNGRWLIYLPEETTSLPSLCLFFTSPVLSPFFQMSLLLSLSVVFIEVSKSFVSFFIYSLLTKALLSFKKINNSDQENIQFLFLLLNVSLVCFPLLLP